jgi:single-stranded DNA-specific DHH superfamily exonuclease
MFEKFDKFVKNLKEEDKIALFFDPDPDGISAGVLLTKSLKKIRGKGVDLVLFQNHGELEISDVNIGKLVEKEINKVFMVDLAADQYPEKIEKIALFAELCIIDHHKVYQDMNSDKILHIKPQMLGDENPSSYVTAKMVYDLFSRHIDLSDFDWLAAIGIIGDAAWKRWRSFVDKVCEKNGLDKNKVLESKIGHTMRAIASAPEFGFDVIQECFDVVNDAKTMDDIENSSLIRYRKIIGDALYMAVKDYRINAKRLDDLIFYQFECKYSIGSTLSTRVSFKEPDKTVIVIQDAGEEFYRISLRRQDGKVKVNDLVRDALEGLDGANGGGHAPAAGGRVLKKDLEIFKERVLKILGKK